MKKIIAFALTLAMLCTMSLFSGVIASAEAPAWDGTAAASFSGGGDGSAENPYQIGTAAELKLFANIVNGTGLPAGFTQKRDACAKLTADIVLNTGDLNGYNGTDDNSWRIWASIGKCVFDPDTYDEIGSYTGTFDGNNHSVSGVYINDGEAYYIGLFGYVTGNGVIKNLGVMNSYIKGSTYVGGVCGKLSSRTMTDCYNSGTVSGTGNHVGGVCGESPGNMTDCYNSGTVSGLSAVGGVCGESYGDMTDCYNSGAVSGTGENVGGVCGTVANIDYCYNTGTVSGRDLSVGGVCGQIVGDIRFCHNSGTVSGSIIVGGVCGYSDGAIISCYNIGMVSGDDYIGSVTGLGFGTQTNCYTLESRVTFTVSSNQSNDNSTAKTESEIKTEAFVALLNNGEDKYILLPDSYPLLTWQVTDTVIKPNTDDKTGDISVTYTVNPSYTVTIPAEVTLGGTSTVSASDVILDEGEQLEVSITGTGGSGKTAFEVALSGNPTDKLTYTVKKDTAEGSTVASGEAVLTISEPKAGGASGTQTLYFIAPTDDAITYAGDYSGTVTFTVSVVAVEA